MAESKIKVSFMMDASELTQGMKVAGTSLDQFGKKAEVTSGFMSRFSAYFTAGALLEGLKKIGTAILELAKAFGEALYEGSKKCVEEFMAFEDAMRNVNKIAGQSEDEFQKTTEAFLKLAKELGKDPTELAKTLEKTTKTTHSQKEAFDQLRASVELAEAANISFEEANALLTTGMENFGDELESSATLAEKLAAASKATGISIDELTKTFGKSAEEAKKDGIAIDDYIGTLAELTKANGQSKASASELTEIMKMIKQPSDELTVAFEKATGKSIGLYNAQNGLVETLKKVKEIAKESKISLEDLTKSEGASKAITTLAKDEFNGMAAAIYNVKNSTFSLIEMLKQQDAKIAETMERWQNLGKLIMIELGQKLSPILADLLLYTYEIADQFEKWITSKDAIAGINQVIDATRVSIFYMIESLREMLKNIGEVLGKSKDGADGASVAMSALAWAIRSVAVMFRFCIATMEPFLIILADTVKMLVAIKEGRWNDAWQASIDAVSDSYRSVFDSVHGGIRSLITAHDDLDKAAEQSARRSAEAQIAANKRVEAERAKAEEAHRAQISKTAEAQGKAITEAEGRVRELTATEKKELAEREKNRIAALEKEIKADKEAQEEKLKNSLETERERIRESAKLAEERIRNENDRAEKQRKREYEDRQTYYMMIEKSLNEYQKKAWELQNRAIQRQMDLETEARNAKEKRDLEAIARLEKSKLKSLDDQYKASVNNLDKTTEAQIEAAKKSEAINESSYQKMTGVAGAFFKGVQDGLAKMPTKPLALHANVTGLEGLNSLGDKTININGKGVLADLSSMLSSTIHKDNMLMLQQLHYITNNTAEIWKRIPPAATGIGG